MLLFLDLCGFTAANTDDDDDVVIAAAAVVGAVVVTSIDDAEVTAAADAFAGGELRFRLAAADGCADGSGGGGA